MCAAHSQSPDRRAVLRTGAAVVFGGILSMPRSALAADAEPPKLTGLTVEQMRDRIKTDFQTKQYYTTGNFSPELFTDGAANAMQSIVQRAFVPCFQNCHAIVYMTSLC